MSAADVTPSYAPEVGIDICGREMAGEMAARILSVEVEQELNQSSAFTFTLQDEFEDGRFRFLDSDDLKVDNRVRIALGYAEARAVVLEGKIKNVSCRFESGVSPTITVEGVDLAHEQLAVPSEARVYEDVRDSDVVVQIASDVGLRVTVQATSVVHAVKTKPGGQSYLEFLAQLASSNQYRFQIVADELKFGPDEGEEPTCTLGWGRDLITFEPQLNTAESVTEVVVRGWDEANKELIEARATRGSETLSEGGARRSSEVAGDLFGDVVRVITDRPVRSMEEARDLAQAELERCGRSLMTGSLEVLGRPGLAPGRSIMIDGCGDLFSGVYGIDRVVHSYGDSGYRTRLEVRRNAV